MYVLPEENMVCELHGKALELDLSMRFEIFPGPFMPVWPWEIIKLSEFVVSVNM